MDSLLKVRNLNVDYVTEQGPLRAVDNFNLDIAADEVVGLVGESGCGKSTAAFAIARLNRPPAVTVSGTISIGDLAWSELSEAALRPFRWKALSLVMQSAINALNPVMTVGDQIIDTLLAGGVPKAELRPRMLALFELVGLTPETQFNPAAFSHQLSGGERQRVCIAMALAFNPKLIIMDEPTTALDVVKQKEIMTKIMALKMRLGISMLFISHDLNLVASVSDRIVVMYAGQIIEQGLSRDVFLKARHPYTRGLIAATLTMDTPLDQLSGIAGEPPNLNNLPNGCRFQPRCQYATADCERPVPLSPVPTSLEVHSVRCLHPLSEPTKNIYSSVDP